MRKPIRSVFRGRHLIGAVVMACLLAGTAGGPAAAADDWKAEWERVKAAARKEGKLVIAIPPNPTLRQKIEKIMAEKFGIQVELVLARGSLAAPRIAEEFKAGVHYFDVAILSAQQVMTTLRPLGAIQPLANLWILPEVKDPKQWWGGHIYSDKGQKFAYSPSAYMLDNVWYNGSAVKVDEVKSWDDLLKPKFKNKIGLFDPRIGGAGRGIWGFVWKAKGEEYLTRLAAQNLVLGKRRPLADQLAKGKVDITIGPTFYTFRKFVKAGLPVKPFPRLREGSYVSVGNGGPVAMAKPANPNAAKVFVNYLLSKEGQDMYSRAHVQATRRLDVDTSWMPSFGVRPAKDSITVADFHARENQSEASLSKVRHPALKFARKLFD